MKTYILLKNNNIVNNADNIKVSDIFGIYLNRCKGFWECKLVNLKNKIQPNYKSYILKEINLETNEITNSYYLHNKNTIKDDNDKSYKIPIFYNNLVNLYNKK